MNEQLPPTTVGPIVTPTSVVDVTNGQTQPIPGVALGENHRDYSDGEGDGEGDSILAFLMQSPPITVQEGDEGSDCVEGSESVGGKRTLVFPETTFVVGADDNYSTQHIPITNVVIPFRKLIQFMVISFACKSCLQCRTKKFTGIKCSD